LGILEAVNGAGRADLLLVMLSAGEIGSSSAILRHFNSRGVGSTALIVGAQRIIASSDRQNKLSLSI
jgi:hypothetical protein